jgi:hypothetical protein
MKKKILNIILITSILGSQVQASSDFMQKTFKDSVLIKTDIMSSGTEDIWNKGYHASSPNIAFRFKHNSNPNRPLWQFTAGGIEADCNGFNIKSFGMSLLGLDQLGDMLHDAGSSLAYGFMVAIVYSLPGVSNVFKTINQWAKDIQKLLGSGCNAGKVAGAALIKATGYDKEAVEDKMMSYIPSANVASAVQEGVNGAFKMLGANSDVYDNGKWDFSGSKTIDSNEKSDSFMAAIRNYFNDSSLGGQLMFNYYEENPVKLTNAIKIAKNYGYKSRLITSIDVIYSFDKDISGGSKNHLGVYNIDIGDMTNGTGNSDDIKMRILAYAFVLNTVGDIGIAATSFKEKIKQLTKAWDAFIGSSDTSKDEQAKAKKIIREFLKNPKNLTTKYTIIGRGANSSKKVDGDAIAEFIWNGFDTNSSQVIKDFKAPIISNYLIRSNKGEDENKELIPLVLGTGTQKDLFSNNFKYDGALKASTCLVNARVYSDGDANKEKECGLTLLIPNLSYYIKIIKDSSKNDAISLMDILTKYNAYYGGVNFLNLIMSQLTAIKGLGDKVPMKMTNQTASGSNNTTKTDEVVNATKGNTDDPRQGLQPIVIGKDATIATHQKNLRDSLEKVIIAARKELRKKAGDIIHKKDLDAAFDRQDTKNKEKGFGAMDK